MLGFRGGALRKSAERAKRLLSGLQMVRLAQNLKPVRVHG